MQYRKRHTPALTSPCFGINARKLVYDENGVVLKLEAPDLLASSTIEDDNVKMAINEAVVSHIPLHKRIITWIQSLYKRVIRNIYTNSNIHTDI